MEKKWPKFTIFQRKKFLIARIFYDNFLLGNWEYKACCFCLLSYLVCGQIWPNHLMDDHHLSYITQPNQCSSIQNQRPVFPNWCTAGCWVTLTLAVPFFPASTYWSKSGVEWSGVRAILGYSSCPPRFGWPSSKTILCSVAPPTTGFAINFTVWSHILSTAGR
jgi:hypothetical protein